ncbi:hypothetical protein [Streptomyces triticirhizae]|uniref:Uncharacterized protein n=1 Tax=Streptomyces triticirhizae TaxID=2483353 RepID=A0A3M2KW06_9ACTN|nr:hypothetical protein [Streptomyces triticirhizae]RMI28630.1 hypothetical protein EBN88_28185 [Streptomyces triticirhizae]
MTSRTPREPRLRLVPQTSPQRAPVQRRTAERRRTPRPPKGVLPPDRLARQARTLLTDAVRVAHWARDAGVSPEQDLARAAGELAMSTAELRENWSRARLAGLLEIDGEGGAVRAGWRLRAWDRDDTAALRGWVALFDAWCLARPAPPDADPSLVTDVVAAMPQLLSVMRLSEGPVTAAGLIDLMRRRVAELRAERPDGSGPEAPVSADAPIPEEDRAVTAERVRLLGWALDALSSVGALTLHARGDRPARARLTDLGSWAMWTKLEQICVAAQSPAGNIEQSAVAMLRGCANLTPGPARAEYRAWLAVRPTAPAVDELLAAARGEDALIRGLAFQALRVVGAPASEAVRAVVDDPVLRPYALLWLADHEGGDPRDRAESSLGVLTRSEATWLWVDTASAAQEHGAERLLLDHLDTAPQLTVAELVDEIRTCGHPRTVQVLLALAAVHPDQTVAKRVRRAAFQVHSGGA